MFKNFRIGKKKIGDKYGTFIVAEISGNHGGQIQNAIKLIKKAKEAGADAVKLQTYTADSITLNSNKKDFIISRKSPWKKFENFWNLYNYAHTPFEWHKELFNYAKKINIEIFSSPFDEYAVDLLEKLGCPAYKIASPEINHIPLLEKVASTKKPVILSTGLASIKEIHTALKIFKKNNNKIIVLKCCSSYPAKFEELNLLTIQDIKKRFNVLSGLSDHSTGVEAPLVAVALGANMVEKHFKLNFKSVDSFFSLNQKEFKEMVKKIRICEKALGKISYDLSKESKLSLVGKRSIYASNNIKIGEKINKKNIKVVRPSYGLHPSYYKKILGKISKRNINFGSRIYLADLKK
jgi:pseudaminic acid synthase